MTTRYFGKAETAATEILDAFKRPQDLPAALAPIFIKRRDGVPCRSWSWSNQLITALRGHADARGFRQWQLVGRHVNKGERSFTILSPVIKKRENAKTGKTESFLLGFKGTAVFGLRQTDGAELPVDVNAEHWIESLPLLEVAREWGLSVETYNGRENAYLGLYRHGQGIALGVENFSTWAHEMCHAADDRNGSLSPVEQKWTKETVAELGGSVLLTCLGMDHDADLGGCFEYVSAYSRDAGTEPVTACQRMLRRTCDAVALILDTAEQLASNARPASCVQSVD
jgi:hypothetical protein